MLEEFLGPIYEEAAVISKLKNVVDLIRVHDDHHAVLELNELFPRLGGICKRYVEWDREECMILWQDITRLNEIEGDLILVGDVIEFAILPKLQKYISNWGHIKEKDEKGFELESTASGFLTLKDIGRNLYFHSTVDPMEEARKLAEYIYEPEKKEFSVLGCGLGYLIYQLYCISNGSIVINIYESDKTILEYAYQFGVLSWIPEECVRVITDDDILSFLHSIEDEEVGCYLFFPEIGRLPENIRPIITELYIQYSTPKKLGKDMKINFWRNLNAGCMPVSKFNRDCIKDEVIVVAAGPSLDDCMDYLRENIGKRTIIAVGTVFKKLINARIQPDLVVVMDPQKRTLKQIEGVENQKTPMILAMASYWGFAAKYQGEKYLVPAMGLKEVMDYAKENGEEPWAVGGTVTALAIEVAVKFGAKRIHFVGVDLAYPGGMTHATDTMDREQKKIEKLTPIVGVGGMTVYADAPFIAYREWIEAKIKETPQIEYVNMSSVGARIKGSKEVI